MFSICNWCCGWKSILFWSSLFFLFYFKCALCCNIFAFHMCIFYCAIFIPILASVASCAVAVGSVSDPSVDFSQPRWVLVEARVAQILWGPLVQVVVQHRCCEQENIWGCVRMEKHQNIQKLRLRCSESDLPIAQKLQRVTKVVGEYWVRGYSIAGADTER